MQDRVSLHPGRVKMTPVAGQANTYDMVRADEPTQVGTPLNKGTLLRDATAVMFGLGADAVPDAVLALLGEYAEHWWRTYTDKSFTGYIEKRTNVSGTVFSSTKNTNVTIAKEIDINQQTGTISLKNPTTYTLRTSSDYDDRESYAADAKKAVIPGYMQLPDGVVLYFPEGVYASTDANYGAIAFGRNEVTIGYPQSTGLCAKVVSSAPQTVEKVEINYLKSANRNAYPDSGSVGNVAYTYLGIPLQSVTTAIRAEMGSYIGTGTYGKDNPNKLNLSFRPRFLVIQSTISPNPSYIFPITNSITADFKEHYSFYVASGGTNYGIYLKVSGVNEIQWCADSSTGKADAQANISGVEYSYLAIG